MNQLSNSRLLLGLAWLVLGALILATYEPGLRGDYVFDDLSNIVNNSHLHLKSLEWSDIRSAAGSGDAGPLGRPLSVLSFALNYYFTGLNPFFFKATNLLIHVANTLLVGQLAQVLLSRFLDSGIASQRNSTAWWGWTVAALWGLHPLNLTSVLYVVQRMTSLSTFFGLLALLVYTGWRARGEIVSREDKHWSRGLTGSAVIILLMASAFSKESGLLFVPLLLWIEYIVFGFRSAGVSLQVGRWPLRHVVSIVLAMAAAFIVFFVLPRMLSPGAFLNRDFTLLERALTESRVIFYYLRLLAIPSSSELSLYHDDIVISHGLFDPPITALALAALVGISALAIFCYRRWPIFLFAWGWFLISHAMESTVFPLELAHEHRNYFATIGIFLAVPVVLWKLAADRRRTIVLLLGTYALLLTIVTWTRSEQWSNNVDNALIEAINHPRSARANYNLGRTYLRLLDKTGEERFGPLADEAFRATLNTYNPGVGAYFALLHSAYYRGGVPDPEIVSGLKHGLQTLPFYNENTSFLQSFLNCQVERHCHMPDMEAVEIFVAALDNPRASSRTKGEVNKLLAQYFISRFGDIDKGIEFIGDAVAAQDDASTRIMYAQAFRLKGRMTDAAEQIELASRLDRRGVFSALIERERAAQRAAPVSRPKPD